jgi:sec-independent protein translocase protein TatA
MRGLFEGWHLIILVLLIVLLFGAKRLPDAARGLGRSLRIFKSEVSQLKDDDAKAAPRSTESIEGRVVDGTTQQERAAQQQRAGTPGESSRDL